LVRYAKKEEWPLAVSEKGELSGRAPWPQPLFIEHFLEGARARASYGLGKTTTLVRGGSWNSARGKLYRRRPLNTAVALHLLVRPVIGLSFGDATKNHAGPASARDNLTSAEVWRRVSGRSLVCDKSTFRLVPLGSGWGLLFFYILAGNCHKQRIRFGVLDLSETGGRNSVSGRHDWGLAARVPGVN